MNRLVVRCICWLVAMIVATGLWAAEQKEPETAEQQAWESALRTGTPSGFSEYFHKYPTSPHIRTRTGTVRGRYWFNMHDQSQGGVIVTVEGMNVLVNVSLEEAKRLEVIGSRTATPGLTTKAEGITFNYIYGEIVEGDFIVAKMVNKEVVKEVIEPRDHLNSTVVLSADETRLLTWDLSKAKIATQPDPHPTFIASAAAMQPFSNVPPSLSKEHTPASQGFTIEQNVE